MATSYAPHIVSDGIIGCWDAGSRRSYPGTGTTWYDVVGGQNGTLVNGSDGSLTFNSAHGGYLEDFDGTDDYVTIPDSDYLDSITSAITISVWVRPCSIADRATGIGTIVSKSTAASWSSPYASWNMRLRHGTSEGDYGTETAEFWAAGSYTTGGGF